MSYRWNVNGHDRQWHFVHRTDLHPDEHDRVAPSREARRRAEESLGLSTHGTMMDMLQSCGYSVQELEHLDAVLMRHMLQVALDEKQIVLLDDAPEKKPGGGSLPDPKPKPDPGPPPPNPKPAPVKTWVEIEMHLDDGSPYQGKYRIKLPSGEVREGQLDHQGGAYIDGIDPGNCDVSFPDIDGGDWSAA